MNIAQALQEPLNNMNGETVQETFSEIAKNLFNNFCIKCGEKTFYFAEIEFYYYDKDTHNQKWNRETYPRTKKDAGDLFFHYSGCDICFDSDFEKGRFGGILIRSLYDKKEDKYITGPTVCANEILNSCSKSKEWPKIEYSEHIHNYDIKQIKRYGIPQFGNEQLCFYDSELRNKCSNKFEKAKWDFDKNNDGKNPKLMDFTRSYNRFK